MIELLIIAAAVYGVRQAWKNGTRAAAQRMGAYHASMKKSFTDSPVVSRMGEAGPKVAAGAATATYGSWLGLRAFFKDWGENWRAGRDAAMERWNVEVPETSETRETPDLSSLAPEGVSLVKEPREATNETSGETPPIETPETSEVRETPDLAASETTDPLADFDKHVYEAVSRFGENINQRLSESTSPRGLVPDEVREEWLDEIGAPPRREPPPLTEEEQIALTFVMKDPNVSVDDAMSALGAAWHPRYHQAARDAHLKTYRAYVAYMDGEDHPVTSQEGEEMPTVVAQGQGTSHTYVTEAEEPPTSTNTNGASLQREEAVMPDVSAEVNIESLAADAKKMRSYATQESEAAGQQAAQYQKFAGQLSAQAEGLQAVRMPALAAQALALQERVQAIAELQKQVASLANDFSDLVGPYAEEINKHVAIRDAHQTVSDSQADGRVYA